MSLLIMHDYSISHCLYVILKMVTVKIRFILSSVLEMK